MNPKILALYLPQFYPLKENDAWWGKGFTEWTNVGRAKPLWKGHYQPKVPADLGYYDLRVPEVREQQAELAREAGVTGFLYWHYWFGNGRRIMERVFQEVLDSGKPDYPFALAWANHSWYKKTWSDDDQYHDECLIEQTYPGIEDARQHFDLLLKAFKDERYIKIDGRPILYVFKSEDLPIEYINWFHLWAKESGFKGLYLIGNTWGDKAFTFYKALGFQAIVRNNVLDLLQTHYSRMPKYKMFVLRIYRRSLEYIKKIPHGIADYSALVHNAVTQECKSEGVIPQIFPNWDHSPRSGRNASYIYYNAEPNAFYEMACDALEAIKDKPSEEQIIIIKSWNEWGEGNYMEPDLKYGHGYIKALRRAVDKYK